MMRVWRITKTGYIMTTALLCLASMAAAVDVLVQAEDVIVSGAVRRPGYAFTDADDETADWASINSSPSPGFPNAPGHFAIDFRSLPPGPYRLWARLARWGGTTDTTPIPAVTFADNAGHNLQYVFPDDGTALSTSFAMKPGGMVPAEGEWGWLPLFETSSLQGKYELTVTGEAGQGGSGNYKGLWLDAFRFEAKAGAPLPALPEDKSLPGRWEGVFYLSPQGPGPNMLSITFPGATRRPADGTLVRRMLPRPLEAGTRTHLALWLMSAVQMETLWLRLRDSQGQVVEADVCELANDRPLQPGTWYLVLAPLRHVRKLAAIELSALAGSSVPEASITVHAPRLVALPEARKALAAQRPLLSPNAFASARLTFRVLDFPRQPVGRDKKVILWARGGLGGMPTPAVARRRIPELHSSGADGIVISVNPIIDGQEQYFPDLFMSAQRLREEDFAQQVADLRKIEWGPVDHSLLRLNVMPGTVDWFDPEWSAVVEKARLAGRFCRIGRLKGIMFDTEQYHWDRGIFRYENRPLKAQKTVAEYAAQARVRGREMAQAMVAELPEIDVLTTFAGSLRSDGTEFLVPFLEGMAGVPGCHVYDGCEPAYPFRTLRNFIQWSDKMEGFSQSIGQGFGLWLNPPYGSYTFHQPADSYRSPEGVAHSLHYALRLSDKYVWLYAEGELSYWPDKTPAAYYDAIRAARLPQDPQWVPPLLASRP